MAVDPLESSHPLRPAAHYRLGAILFHWAMFVLVVIVGALGLLHDSWPKQTQAFWINVHALTGILLWLVFVARFGYRLRHSPPALPMSIGAFPRRFAGAVHLTLYGLMFVIPIIGFVTFIYHGRVFDFGFFDLNLGIRKNRVVFAPTEDLHGYLAYALFALASLHALAALWHRYILHDGVLARMWPIRRQYDRVTVCCRREMPLRACHGRPHGQPAPHPRAPPPNVIFADRSSASERRYFESILRPQVESGCNVSSTPVACAGRVNYLLTLQRKKTLQGKAGYRTRKPDTCEQRRPANPHEGAGNGASSPERVAD